MKNGQESAVRFVAYKRKLNYIYTCSVQPNRLVPTVTRKMLNQVPAGILRVQFVIYFCMNTFLVCVVRNYLNSATLLNDLFPVCMF